MPSEREVERLRKVYQGYREDERARARWNSANPGNRAIFDERRREMRKMLEMHGYLPLDDRRILEVGCGTGGVLAGLLEQGARPANLYGVDVLPERIEEASRLYPEFHFRLGNAEKLDFPDAYFQLVLFFTVFSSILDDGMAENVAREAIRVLQPGGAILWYDFRYDNPRNPHVRGVRRRRIVKLFQGLDLHLRTLTLLPPLSRRLGRLTPVLYPVLVKVPPLRTHYLGLLKRLK